MCWQHVYEKGAFLFILIIRSAHFHLFLLEYDGVRQRILHYLLIGWWYMILIVAFHSIHDVIKFLNFGPFCGFLRN